MSKTSNTHLRLTTVMLALLCLAQAATAAYRVTLRQLAASVMTTGAAYGYLPEDFGQGQEFVITDDLVGVAIIPAENIIVARDNERCARQWYSTQATVDWALDFVDNLDYHDSDESFTQHNWVRIKLPSSVPCVTLIDKVISGGTIGGVIDQSGRFDLLLDASATTAYTFQTTGSASTTLNTYSMANFNYEDGKFCNGNLWASVPTFMMIPKPGEVANIRWARYDGDNLRFDTPTRDEYGWGNNNGLTGGGAADFSYFPAREGKTYSDYFRGPLTAEDFATSDLDEATISTLVGTLPVYSDFTVLIGARGEELDDVIQAVPRRASGEVTAIPRGPFQHDFLLTDYVLYPLTAPATNDIITAVADIAATPQAVRLYDLQGRPLREPQHGVNIRVTTTSDGRSTTEKFIY